jgi:general secretion pathway protein H
MSGTGDIAAVSRADAGETLIEALVVVAILGMVAAIGFPEMRRQLATLAQHQTVATVAARLRGARAEALRRDAPVVFAITRDGTGFATTGGRVDRTPEGVVLAVSPARAGSLVFYGDGSSSGGSVWVGAGRRTTRVDVTAGTGVVAVGGA